MVWNAKEMSMFVISCPVEVHRNLIYRRDDSLELNDIEASNRFNIDTTGLVCCWPSEEVLAFYCINRSDMFRSKRVLELGAGYGLAGLVIAASANAGEVVISDGNPQDKYFRTEGVYDCMCALIGSSFFHMQQQQQQQQQQSL
uniref:Calmodulin-lysine N-methyltransferase n=1 Tax=Aegilops tauschii TaxID=37682 RepID=M8BIV5_AEGTA